MNTEDLSYEILDDFKGLESLREDWDNAVMRLGGPIYMSFDWVRIWWEFYGKRSLLRIFIFRSVGQIVGIVPIYIDAVGLLPLKLRVARLLGASLPPKVFDPPVDMVWAEKIWCHLVEELFVTERCDLFSYGPVSGEHGPAGCLSAVAASHTRIIGDCAKLQQDVHTLYELPANYDIYFTSLDSKERKVRRKKLRELEAAHTIRTESVSDAASVNEEFERFVEHHTQQWEMEGRPGHFNAWPDALEYNRALVKQLGGLGRVRFYKLWAGDQVATSQYTYAFGKTLYAELPARMSGPIWDKFSLGCTSQIKLIEAAIGDGMERMESGLGHYGYKIATGGKESPVNVISLLHKSLSSRAKVAIYRKLNALLRLFFHKAWYRTIMPRLPAVFRRGQSRLLLRLDF